MRIIVPMAGRGTRLRPHTLTTPKPLLPVAGTSIVQRLVEDIAAIYPAEIHEVVYVIARDFGPAVEESLIAIAHKLNAEGRITYQDEPLGTAHAIQCAGDSLNDELIIAFADTLFKADFTIDRERSGMIWVKRVADPKSFGVVKVNDENVITDMVEKPDTPVSDLAIIGVYYVKDGAGLKREIDSIIAEGVTSKGEYQLTDALARLKDKGAKFVPGQVEAWMDCGNKANLLDTNHHVLEFEKHQELINSKARVENSLVNSPCFIDEGAVIHNSIIGPYVSIGPNAYISNSVIEEAIVRNGAQVEHAHLKNTILGQHTKVLHQADELNLGDYSSG
jgi:glucose-1-phosphate thymidylyltransferase